MAAAFLLSPLVSACGSVSNAYAGAAGARAAREFPCAREELHETYISGTSYELTGCGREATYTCFVTKGWPGGIITCMREGNLRPE